MYALVLVEIRYVAPCALILLLWLLGKLRVAADAAPAALRRVKYSVLLGPILALAYGVGRDAVVAIRNAPDENWAVARELHGLGVAPGSAVGSIGTGLDAYWAHLAGLRIVAEIPDQEQSRYIAADTVRKQKVLSRFASAGVQVVVTRNPAVADVADDWQEVPGTRYFIKKLSAASLSPVSLLF